MTSLPDHTGHVGSGHIRSTDTHPAVTSRFKRTVDVIVSAVALLLLALPLLILAAAIRVTSRGPALFRQERVGVNGQPFTVLKFRTMFIDNDDTAHRELCIRQLQGEDEANTSDGAFKLEADPRITPIGGWLRRLSLDELPQLINVLRGEMSLVGPRPGLQWEVDLYQPRHLRRMAVRPGITGLWQVSGRNQLNMLQMLDLDLRYVEEWAHTLDLRIIATTPVVLFRGDGAR